MKGKEVTARKEQMVGKMTSTSDLGVRVGHWISVHASLLNRMLLSMISSRSPFPLQDNVRVCSGGSWYGCLGQERLKLIEDYKQCLFSHLKFCLYYSHDLEVKWFNVETEVLQPQKMFQVVMLDIMVSVFPCAYL